MNGPSSSAEQIIEEYRRREREMPADYYALHRPANLFMRQGQMRGLASALQDAGLLPLNDRKIVEIGCGRGNWLSLFEAFDARRANLSGIELADDRAADCRGRLPGADIRTGDASRLPWPDAHFDLVFQSMVFTSIPDLQMKEAVSREMARVCKPSGAIVWYDFHVNNPRNPHVRGVNKREIQALFPNHQIRLRRVTLAPPLVRRLVNVSWIGCELLEKLRILNTHYFGVLRRSV